MHPALGDRILMPMGICAGPGPCNRDFRAMSQQTRAKSWFDRPEASQLQLSIEAVQISGCMISAAASHDWERLVSGSNSDKKEY